MNEYQLRLGRQRQVWFIPIADERVGVQVKLWNPLRTRAIPAHFCGGDSLRRSCISSVGTFHLARNWTKMNSDWTFLATCSRLSWCPVRFWAHVNVSHHIANDYSLPCSIRVSRSNSKTKINHTSRIFKCTWYARQNYQCLRAWELHTTEQNGEHRCRWFWPMTLGNEEEPVWSSPVRIQLTLNGAR